MEEVSEFIKNQEKQQEEGVAKAESPVDNPGAGEGMRITMVSHFPKEQFNGLAVLRKWMEKKGFLLEAFEYKVLVKKEIKRPINPKNPNGPQEKVIIDEKVNLNTDFKNLRQLIARIGQEPQNVLTIQLERAKGEYFCLNLIFKHVLKTGRPILVTHLPSLVKSQLFCIPDLQFVTIPKEVEANEDLKQQFLDRAKRTRGMQATMRELVGLPYFPGKIINKISSMVSGQKVELTDAESINLLLLADLHNRYSAMLDTFEMDVKTQKVAVPALAYMFNELMQDVKLPLLIKRFQDYFGEYEGKFTSKSQVFSYLYSILPKLDEKKPIKTDVELSSADLFKRIRSLFLNSRSQFDPYLWKKCMYIDLDLENIQESLSVHEPVMDGLAVQMRKLIEGYQAATSGDLNDVWSVHTCYRHISGREVDIDESQLSGMEASLIRQAHLPWLNLRIAAEENPAVLHLFNDSKEKPFWKLHKSIHLISRAYGVFIAHQLKNGVMSFLEPGLQNLIERYGSNFFDILYETCVKEKNLPISRNQLAKWLQDKKLVGTVKNRGWIASEMETDFDKNINQKILNFSGESSLPMVFTQDDFEDKYQSSMKNLESMYDKLEETADHPFMSQLLRWKQDGLIYPFFKGFSRLMSNSEIFLSLQKMVSQAADPLLDQISSAAVNGKLVLKLPLSFEKFLLIGHTFDVQGGSQGIKLHLIAVPVPSSEKLKGLSRAFSEGMEVALEGGYKEGRKLEEIASFLASVKEHEFYFLNRFMVIDRMLKMIVEERRNKKHLQPAHFKNFIKDQQKLLVGNTKGMNLSGIFAYETGPNQLKAEDLEPISFGQMLEALESIASVTDRLKKIKADALQTLTLLSKFNDKVKATDSWKQLATLVKNFELLVSTPADDLNEAKFAKLQELADRLRILFLKNRDTSGTLVNRLIGVWNKKNKNDPEGIQFYMPFAENQGNKRDDLVALLHKAKVHMARIRPVRVIIFFPEGAKQFHINHLLDFSDTLKGLPFPVEMFIETSSVSRDQVEELCKVYHPTQLFRISRLDPLIRKT